jgi:hypothetical protein
MCKSLVQTVGTAGTPEMVHGQKRPRLPKLPAPGFLGDSFRHRATDRGS